MAAEPRGPFREVSLERLSSPERLDQLLRLADSRTWLPLVTAGLLLAGVLIWAVVGHIPVNVEGKGILVRPRGVVELQSPGVGYVEEWNVAVNDTVERGQVLGRIARPDLELQIALLRIKEQELGVLQEAARMDLEPLRGGRREPHIETARKIAADLHHAGLALIAQERASLREQHRLASDFAASSRKNFEGQVQLRDQGLLAPEAALSAEVTRRDAEARVASLESALRELDQRALELDDQYFSRVQQLAEFRLDLEVYEQRAADVKREIETLESRLIQESRIASEHAGRILEITVEVGQFLAPGQRLGAVDIGAGPLRGVTYFTIRDGKRLAQGDTIHVTPDSVERQRYGSIEGIVTSVSDFPVTLGQAAGMIGNREVAETLVAGGYRMEVLAELQENPLAPSGFRWSSSIGPRMEFSAGTTTTAWVGVEERPPITFVLPFLKETLGVE